MAPSTPLDTALRSAGRSSLCRSWKRADHPLEGSATSRDPHRGLRLKAPPQGLNEDELVAQSFTYHLVSEHSVNGLMYAAAREVFGNHGLVDMLVLIGCYLSVCALLNAFAAPAPTHD